MKTVYHLYVLEKDNYFRSNNQLVCKLINIDETDKQIVEHIVMINGKEIKRSITEKIKIDGEYQQLNSYWVGKYFDSLDEVQKYIKQEYELVKSTEHLFYFLTLDDSYDTVVTITNHTSSGLGCSNDYVNLQKLLGLSYETTNTTT